MIPENYCVVDTETTGLDVNIARIVELAAKVVLGDWSWHLSWIILQDQPLPEITVSLTGITDEIVKSQGIPLSEALRQFSHFVGDLTIVGHNALRYDNPLILAEYARAGLTPPSGIGRADQLDTAAMFKAENLGMKKRPEESPRDFGLRVLNVMARGKFNLAHACEVHGITVAGAHRAAGDVEMTDQLFRKMNPLSL